MRVTGNGREFLSWADGGHTALEEVPIIPLASRVRRLDTNVVARPPGEVGIGVRKNGRSDFVQAKAFR
jgi:hypothetical protein